MDTTSVEQDKQISMSSVKGVVTILQGTIAVITTIVTVAFFLFAVNAKTNTNSTTIEAHEKHFEKIEQADKEYFSKSEARQKEILDAINEVRLSLKDKADRKNVY